MTDPRTKRRYNLCHRLRAAGIEVDVENHAIQATCPADIENLLGTTARRLRELMSEYHYIVQFRIPDPPGSVVVRSDAVNQPTALRFFRRKQKQG